MACFIVPATEAVVTTIIKNKADKNHKKDKKKNMFIERMDWLNNMLWGGSALLAFEHLWHGEIVPFFPFLTKAADTASLQEMLFEMGTSGVGMAVLVTCVWAVMVAAAKHIEKIPVSEKTPLSRG